MKRISKTSPFKVHASELETVAHDRIANSWPVFAGSDYLGNIIALMGTNEFRSFTASGEQIGPFETRSAAALAIAQAVSS